MRIRLAILVFLSGPGSAAFADALVPVRTIPSKAVLSAADLARSDLTTAGAITRLDDAVGMEARVTLYAGRPLFPGDVGPAAVVEKNQIVQLVYSNAALRIETEGRALDRAAPGERARIMNMGSRAVVTGIVQSDGTVEVGR